MMSRPSWRKGIADAVMQRQEARNASGRLRLLPFLAAQAAPMVKGCIFDRIRAFAVSLIPPPSAADDYTNNRTSLRSLLRTARMDADGYDKKTFALVSRRWQ